MSDPAKYRTKEELEEYKEKDPITSDVLNTIKENNWATEEEIEAINNKVKAGSGGKRTICRGKSHGRTTAKCIKTFM